jgi:NADH-quinone oxidoreductase subunit C
LSSADTEAPEAAEAPAVDEARQEVLELLQAELGDALVGSHVKVGDDLWVRVTREAWREAGIVVRERAGFRYFEFLSAIDWLPSPYGKNEDSPTDPRPEPNTEIVTGYAGGDTRFQVFARVHSLPRKLGVTLKADLPDDDLSIDSWLPVFAGANWHEREAHEMFGISFNGHPYLQHLYLPGAFEGHPLRKDFPLLSRMIKPWPGIVDVEPMPAGDDEASEGEGEEG